MNPYFFLFVAAIFFSLVNVIESKNVNNSNFNIFLFMIYTCKLFVVIYVYFFLLTKEDKEQLFFKKYNYLWFIAIFITLLAFIGYRLYLKYHKTIGPGKAHLFTESFEIIFIFILSYYFLNNKKITINIITGTILILIGIYFMSKDNIVI